MLKTARLSLVDLRAGLNGALIGGPQEINYGLLAFAPLGATFAGVGVALALTVSALAAMLYSLLGAGRWQVIGPRPTLIVLLAGLLTALGERSVAPGQLPGMLMLSLVFAGVLLLLAARMGLGQLFKFLPLPVLAGFTNGVAATLVLAAIPMAMGWGMRWPVLGEWPPFQVAGPLLAILTAVLCLFPLKPGCLRQVPGVLQALVAVSALHFLLNRFLPGSDGMVIGNLLASAPAAIAGDWLNELAWPELHWPIFWLLGQFALAFAAAAALETLAVTAHLEAESTEPTPGNVLLTRLGWIYLLLSPLLLPVAGSLGRSIALAGAGAKSRQGQLFYAFFMIALAGFAAPVISELPVAAVAGILLVVARNMAGENLAVARGSWQMAVGAGERQRQLADFLVMLSVATITVLHGFLSGLLLGTLAAMALFIRDQSRSVVRRIQFGDSCRSLRIRSGLAAQLQLRRGREIVVVEAEGSLFFGSMEILLRRLDALAVEARTTVLDLRRVSDIDSTAAQLLRQAVRRYREQGCTLLLSHLPPKSALRQRLHSCALGQVLPEERWFGDLDSALEFAEDELLGRYGLASDNMQLLTLADSELAVGLSENERIWLQRNLTTRRIQAGAYLFRQGDPGDSLFVILRGAISIHVQQAETGRRLIAFGPGAVLGEMALIGAAPRSADALADQDCELLVLNLQTFRKMQQTVPDLAVAVLQRLATMLAERLRNTTRQLRELAEE